jgi:hypothetical protein
MEWLIGIIVAVLVGKAICGSSVRDDIEYEKWRQKNLKPLRPKRPRRLT